MPPLFLHPCEEGDISFLEDDYEGLGFFKIPYQMLAAMGEHSIFAVIDLFIREI